MEIDIELLKQTIKRAGFTLNTFWEGVFKSEATFFRRLKMNNFKEPELKSIASKLKVDLQGLMTGNTTSEPLTKYSEQNSNQLTNLIAQLDAKDELIIALKNTIRVLEEQVETYRGLVDFKNFMSDVKGLKVETLRREKT